MNLKVHGVKTMMTLISQWLLKRDDEDDGDYDIVDHVYYVPCLLSASGRRDSE